MMRYTPNRHLGWAALGLLSLTLLATACGKAPVPAVVELEVDGVRYDYKTSAAEWDRQTSDGEYSVYALHDDEDSKRPYVGIRYFSGNPVGRLWLFYARPGAKDDDLKRYDCFVPGTLSDGRETLTWTEEDGSARKRQFTGDKGCAAKVVREGNTLTLTFEGELQPRLKKKKKGAKAPTAEDEAKAKADRPRMKGKAVLTLP